MSTPRPTSGSASRMGRHRAMEGRPPIGDAVACAVLSIESISGGGRLRSSRWVSVPEEAAVSLLSTITNRPGRGWTFVVSAASSELGRHRARPPRSEGPGPPNGSLDLALRLILRQPSALRRSRFCVPCDLRSTVHRRAVISGDGGSMQRNGRTNTPSDSLHRRSRDAPSPSPRSLGRPLSPPRSWVAPRRQPVPARLPVRAVLRQSASRRLEDPGVAPPLCRLQVHPAIGQPVPGGDAPGLEDTSGSDRRHIS